MVRGPQFLCWRQRHSHRPMRSVSATCISVYPLAMLYAILTSFEACIRGLCKKTQKNHEYGCNVIQGQPWLSQRTLDIVVVEPGYLDVLVMLFGSIWYELLH